MLNRILRAFITALGTMAIPGILMLVQTMYQYYTGQDPFLRFPPWVPFVVYMLGGVLSAFIFFILSKSMAGAIERGIAGLERRFREMPSMSLLAGGIGLIIGLIIAALFSVVIGLIPVAWVSVPLTIIFYIIFGYLGMTVGIERRHDIANYFTTQVFGHGPAREETKEHVVAAEPKILDTSVIIDGRIFDILHTGVMDGDVLVPSFVLAELQRIADSPDAIRRARGRRGLSQLTRLQKELERPVHVLDKDYPGMDDVDVKLCRLAKERSAKLITTDYNLNRVAQVQEIAVFNINDLANALKPVLAAGEKLRARIVKDGREPGQGVAYLDDGTMIVVEGGSHRIGQDLEVTVTSILQTSAGRMIFAKAQ